MNTYRLIISSPDGTLFDGEITALFVRGGSGDLAILAGHVPLLAVVVSCRCRIALSDGTEKAAQCDGGILKVGADCTTLLSSRFTWES